MDITEIDDSQFDIDDSDFADIDEEDGDETEIDGEELDIDINEELGDEESFDDEGDELEDDDLGDWDGDLDSLMNDIDSDESNDTPGVEEQAPVSFNNGIESEADIPEQFPMTSSDDIDLSELEDDFDIDADDESEKDVPTPSSSSSVSELDAEIAQLSAELGISPDDAMLPTDISAEDLESLLEMKEEENSNSNGQELDGEALLRNDALLEEDELEVVSKDADFLSNTGEIVLMDPSQNSEDNFKLIYVDIENIAIVKRIRIGNNVTDLVQSIKSTGLLKPIDVAPTNADGVYVLLDGFRRVVACARCGKRRIPCVVNMKVNVPEIPVIEAMYNHCKPYSVKEMIAYIDYLEKEKGIMSASMIEYLLQMNSGDYTKLKDVLNDGDEDIVSKLLNGQYTIEMAFKKLEQRRKKESNEEKEIKKAEKVYGDEEASGASHIAESGELADDGPGLTDEEIKELAIGAEALDEGLEDVSLDAMVDEGKSIEGFQTHTQKPGEREFIDPVVKKAVLIRDKFSCRACDCGGESFISAIDFHHILPVFLGGPDSKDNGITLCLTCHHLVHEYATGDLSIPREKTEEEIDKMSEEEKILYKKEQMRFKRIVRLGTSIREGMAKNNISREKYKKEHPNSSVGRIKPGHEQNRA